MRIRSTRLVAPAIVFLAFTSFALAGWKKTTMGPGGDYPSIALDAQAHPHIFFQDTITPGGPMLRHAFFNGSEWRREIVESGDVGSWTSAAVDSLGHPHVAYRQESPVPGLKYARFDGTNWQITSVDEGGFSTSIALDASDHPHISYVGGASGTDARYATFDGNNWSTETIAAGALYFGATSIALDSAGAAHVSFSDQSLPRKLYYATNSTGPWVVDFVDDGRDGSLALDSDDIPHIAFLAESAGELRYASLDGMTWEIERISDGDAPSLKIDAFDRPHVVFGFSFGGISFLAHVKHDGNDWFGQVIGGPQTGLRSSLALDSVGLPYIASHKLTSSGEGRLLYARLRAPDLSGSWQPLSRVVVIGGELVTGTLVVANQGVIESKPIAVRFFSSDDDLIDPSDTLLPLTVGVGKIKPGRSKPAAFSLTFHTPIAGKRIIALLDTTGTNDEATRDNNAVAGVVP